MDGQVPEYLQQLREEKQPLVEGGLNMRAAIKGDLHCHSSWSDGGSRSGNDDHRTSARSRVLRDY